MPALHVLGLTRLMVPRLAISILNLLLTRAARQAPLLRGQGGQTSLQNASRPAQSHIGGHDVRIPAQLVMTAKQTSLDELPEHLQSNVKKTLNLNPELNLRWFSDHDCLAYLRAHYDDELTDFFNQTTTGMFRGDLCRAAVLAKEGGFYLDLDVELRVPLMSLVANDTTFMSAKAETGTVLNAILASTPGNALMLASIENIRQRYRSNEGFGLLGPDSLLHAVNMLADKNCSTSGHPGVTPAWRCGSEVVRLYKEMRYSCWGPNDWPFEYCPLERIMGTHNHKSDGAEFGLFDWNSKLIGWSRFWKCSEYGCGGGGHEELEPFNNNGPQTGV